MNVFENLLGELRDEQLIEELDDSKKLDSIEPKEIEVEMRNAPELNVETVLEFENSGVVDESAVVLSLGNEDLIETNQKAVNLETGRADILEVAGFTSSETRNEPVNLQPKQKLSGFELFRKRAMEEVSTLQMADNIFSSVEREQMKIISKPYDDIHVKQVLHSFVQQSGEVSPAKLAESEFELRQETETWYSALTERDEKISVQNLRYCCENTRPPLSPPALLALARFYRNAQFSEAVRNKFDLIVTRLFSRDIEDNRREVAFSREELIGHFQELYSEWESIPFYSTEDNDKSINEIVSRFEDLVNEAKNARKFDELIQSDFFNRVRALKRSTSEEFFAPQIATMAIISNIEIGNRYLDLIEVEQENSSNSRIEEKYGFLHDQTISDATNKTIQLGELLSRPTAKKAKLVDLGVIDPNNLKQSKKKARELFPFLKLDFLGGVNKGILAMTVVTIVVTTALFLWVEVFSAPPVQSNEVKTVDMEKTPFKNFINSARLNNEMLFAIATPEWDKLPREKKEDVLKKLLAYGDSNGYKKVHLLDQNSMTIGSATANGIELK